MSDVFISYSRKDAEFVHRLHDALSGAGRLDVWVDYEDILPAARWRAEIASAIDDADNFVFVISPDSISSNECLRELAHAVEQHKRMIAVVWRDAAPAAVPESLAELNYIFCRDRDGFDAAVVALKTAVETDPEWVKEHTRLLTRAVEWHSHERNASLLLRGDDLEAAEEWMAQSGVKKPAPNELQGQYILASRQDETARQRLEQRRAKVAMDAFYRLTYDVREGLKDVPGTNAIRRHFIEGNIEGLADLVEITPDDHAVRELATNYRALAEILWNENEFGEAADAYRRSNDLTRRLVDGNPSEPLFWRDLAAGHANLGLLALSSKPSEAAAEYEKALEAAENAARLDSAWAGMAADLKARVASLRRTSAGAGGKKGKRP